MTILGSSIIALTVLTAVLVGAFVATELLGGDPTLIGGAGTAAGALLGGLVSVELVTSRRRHDG